MVGVLSGFAAIGVVIALGAALAHARFLDEPGQLMLAKLSFFVASPALMVIVLSSVDVTHLFSRNLAATAAGIAASMVLYAIAAKLVWKRSLGETTIGVLAAGYPNASNLGIPISAYVLGDASLVAPMLLLQVLLLQPAALAVLDFDGAGQSLSLRRVLMRPLTNPITVGTLMGLGFAVAGASLPTLMRAPLELIAGMAVPSMLLAYGVSLRLGPRYGHGSSLTELLCITGLKLVVQPVVAYCVARFAFGLDSTALFAVTVLAALPTAQNIFIHATRYDRGVVVARDSVFLTTVLSVPALLVIAAFVA
jgi:predicted permease